MAKFYTTAETAVLFGCSSQYIRRLALDRGIGLLVCNRRLFDSKALTKLRKVMQKRGRPRQKSKK